VFPSVAGLVLLYTDKVHSEVRVAVEEQEQRRKTYRRIKHGPVKRSDVAGKI
jgi:excinuclease UvrABC helicase subunit UvrB